MTEPRLTIREMGPGDVPIRVDYFHDCSDEQLRTMGVDRARLPGRDQWTTQLRKDVARPPHQRESYGVVWEADGDPVGFSTTDRVVIGHEAFMHLHITVPALRGRGLGTAFVKLSGRHYLDVFDLKTLYCEPNALNVAPNRALQRAGFHYACSREATPTPINFPQVVTRWVLLRSPQPFLGSSE